MSIALRGISKHFGTFVAVDGIDLDVPTGELVALLGPSGSGKTSVLRIIAGLETPDAGTVQFHGSDATATHARDRQVGFVFQHYALFGHMSVFENIAFGLRVRPKRQRPGEADLRRRVLELLDLVQLAPYAERFPHELSGGQRQRVALARALAVEPRVLLLDEPFGALDARVRHELRRWLRRLHDEMHVTSVFVTHDQEEALEVADRVVIMNRGRIEQVGTPDEVYERPASPFVLEFLGHVNHLPATDRAVRRYARPHEIAIALTPRAGAVPARLARAATVGAVARMEFAVEGAPAPINVELSREAFRNLALEPGARAYLEPRQTWEFEAA